MSPPVRQYSFSAGELSPPLYGRTDLNRYENGLRACRNMIVMRHGGVTGRPGTQYVGTTLNGGNPVRLLPFIFNETGLGQSYVLELGNQYIAFYQNGGVIVSGGNPYKILSPYLQADLSTLRFSQSADIITITHQNYWPMELKRFGATNWTLSQIAFGAQSDFVNIISTGGVPGSNSYIWLVTSVLANGDEGNYNNSGQTTAGSISAPSPSTPVSMSWYGPTNPPFGGIQPITYRIYRAQVVGGNAGAFGFIGQIPASAPSTPATVVTYVDTIVTPDYTQAPVQVSPFESTMGSGNYPATVGYVQQRRVFANTKNNPIGWWESKPGSYYNYDVRLNTPDDDPIIAQLAGEEVNAIQHILELKFMLMLTAGAEIYVQGNGSGVVTPSAINASTQSQYGCSPLRPLKVGDVVLFNQSLGSYVRDFCFDFAIDGYRGNEITIFSSHLFEGYQLMDWAYQKTPDSIVWAARSDGILLSCTYVREQQILAWARHDLQNGFVENVCSIPENGQYAVYLAVRRVINGVTVRYIERLTSRIWQSSAGAIAAGTAAISGSPASPGLAFASGDIIDATYLDCFVQYDGRNQNGFTINQYQVIAGVNDAIDLAIANGSISYTVHIAPGFYTGATLAAAVQTALNSIILNPLLTWTCTFDGVFMTISDAASTIPSGFQILWGSGPNAETSAALTLGWPKQDVTGFYSVTAPNSPALARSYYISMLLNPMNFADTGTPYLGKYIYIQTGINDGIEFLDVNSVEYSAFIPQGLYSAIDLANAAALAMNAVNPAGGYTATVDGTFGYITIHSITANFQLLFRTTDQNYSRSAHVVLGLRAAAQYSGAGGSIVAPARPSATIFEPDDFAYQQSLTLTASNPYFGPGQIAQVGDQIFLQDALWVSSQGGQGNQLKCTIQAIISNKIAAVTPEGIVPTEYQGIAVLIWARAVKSVSGLSHLEGQQVSVWADRFVVGSPLNSHISSIYTVTGGSLTLDKCYSVIFVGLPMIQDVESLDLEAYFGETMLSRRKRVAKLSVYLYNTRSFFAGSENPDANLNNTKNDPLFQLYEEKRGDSQVSYDQPPELITDQDYVLLATRWNRNGRVFMRNLDPVPFSLLAISPQEEDPVQGGYKRV